jgi:hypothetical protein
MTLFLAVQVIHGKTTDMKLELKVGNLGTRRLENVENLWQPVTGK